MMNTKNVVRNILGDRVSRNNVNNITSTEMTKIKSFASSNGLTVVDTLMMEGGMYVVFSNNTLVQKSRGGASWGSGHTGNDYEIINRFSSLSAALNNVKNMR